MSAKELFSDKKDGSLSKKTECAGVLLSLLVQNKKHLQYLSFDQGIVHFPPPAARKRMLFLKKQQHNITVRPEEKIFLNLKL